VYVLDEIFGNATDLPITEHATDTAGQTLTVFSLFKLTGCTPPRAGRRWRRPWWSTVRPSAPSLRCGTWPMRRTGGGSPASSIKGETLHSLRRDLSFAHEGAIRRRRLDQQTEQTLCLSLVVNAIITFNTVYRSVTGRCGGLRWPVRPRREPDRPAQRASCGPGRVDQLDADRHDAEGFALGG
jgi:hypothetical protein